MLIQAENLTISVGRPRRRRTLFRDLSLSLGPGRLVGLVGPSGSGKTTLGDVLLGLHPPDRGTVRWQGQEIYGPGPLNGKRTAFQKMFQDPGASFFPYQTVGRGLWDVIRYHGLAGSRTGAGRLMISSVRKMGLDREHLDRLPHQLSGGELQRLALARILLLQPSFIVADEPTSRLDISVQARIVRMIAGLVETEGLSVLLISHDLDLVRTVCHRILAVSPPSPDHGPNRLIELDQTKGDDL